MTTGSFPLTKKTAVSTTSTTTLTKRKTKKTRRRKKRKKKNRLTLDVLEEKASDWNSFVLWECTWQRLRYAGEI